MSVPPSHPRPGSFINPWSEGVLIRTLAWLRQVHGRLPVPPPDGSPEEGVPLSELYVPARLGPVGNPGHAPHQSATVDLLDVLDLHRQVVILGEPGSGRTTLVSWLVHSLTDPGRNRVVGRLGRMVPIIVPVRALHLHPELQTLEDLLALLHVLPYWFEGLDELLPELLLRGQVLFVLDDADAVEDAATQEALREAILDGIERFSTCSWVLTAEPAGFTSLPLRDRADAAAPGEPSVAVWQLQPWDGAQVRAYVERWADLSHADNTALALLHALQSVPLARQLSTNPAMLSVLAVVQQARGDLPEERAALLDWLVAGWLRILDNVPGAEAVPVPVRRAWVEAMARAAEADRIAAWDKWLEAGAPSSLESRVRTPPIAPDHAAMLLQTAAKQTLGTELAVAAAHRFVLGAAHRPGVLVARGGGIGFIRADHQRFLAAVHVAVDLEAPTSDRHTTGAAVQTVRGWSRTTAEPDDLSDLLALLENNPDAAQRVYTRLLEHRGDRARTTEELDDLGPLAVALQNPKKMDVPPEVREAAGRLVEEAVRRLATEHGRVPTWAPSIEPLRHAGPLPTLDLSGNARITDIYPIADQRLMYRLDLHGCSGVEDIAPLATLPHLQWADLHGLASVEDISPLHDAQGLRWLDLGGNPSLTDLSPLAGLQGLQALALHDCTGLEDLGPLSAIRTLRALVITGCTGIFDISSLRLLPPGGTVWVRGSGVRVVPPDLHWSVVGA